VTDAVTTDWAILPRMEKPNHFRLVRRRRGWTITDVVNRCETVKDQQYRNLESGSANPARCTARTIDELVQVFWPDLEWRHFLPETPLAFKTGRRRRR